VTPFRKPITAGSALFVGLLLVPNIVRGTAADPVVFTGQEPPPGATAANIAEGAELFKTEGCATCHGPEGKGLAGMTEDITDGEWKFAEGGTFEALVAVLKGGLGPDKTGGMPMPAASTRDLSDDQVTALAAFVWSLNQPAG
jgi:mono/diheme cytochrome c family protein